jgi:single-strand DNA-binding protein
VYLELVLWDKQAELAAQHIVKGQQVEFSGRLDPQPWTGRDGVERLSLEVHGVELEYGAKPRAGADAQDAAAAV